MPCIQDHWQRDVRERNICIWSFQTWKRVVNLSPLLTLYTDICIYWRVYLQEWSLWKDLLIKTLEVNSPRIRPDFGACKSLYVCIWKVVMIFFFEETIFSLLGQLSPYAKKQVLLVHMMNPFLLKHRTYFYWYWRISKKWKSKLKLSGLRKCDQFL